MINEFQYKLLQSAGKLDEAAYDKDAVDELLLYIDNDRKLYFSKIDWYKNLTKKMKKGQYDAKLAMKAFKYLVDDAAKKYRKEFGEYDSAYSFGPREKTAVAQELVDQFGEAWKNKEHDFMNEGVSPSYAKKIKAEAAKIQKAVPGLKGWMVGVSGDPADSTEITFRKGSKTVSVVWVPGGRSFVKMGKNDVTTIKGTDVVGGAIDILKKQLSESVETLDEGKKDNKELYDFFVKQLTQTHKQSPDASKIFAGSLMYRLEDDAQRVFDVKHSDWWDKSGPWGPNVKHNFKKAFIKVYGKDGWQKLIAANTKIKV